MLLLSSHTLTAGRHTRRSTAVQLLSHSWTGSSLHCKLSEALEALFKGHQQARAIRCQTEMRMGLGQRFDCIISAILAASMANVCV